MKAMPRCRRQRRRPQPQTHLQFLRREWFSVASVAVKVIYYGVLTKKIENFDLLHVFSSQLHTVYK